MDGVVEPNTLNLDPDPGFWHNLDPGLCFQFRKKKLKIILKKDNFLYKSKFFKKQMSQKS